MAQFARWTAPCAALLHHRNIRLDADPDTIRGVWRCVTKAEVLKVLTQHFKGDTGKADDFFCETQLDGHHLLPLGAHKRRMVNDLAGFHGVEYLGLHHRTGKVVRYCNAGDTYAPTLCFMGRRMFLDTMGDLIESRRVREDN